MTTRTIIKPLAGALFATLLTFGLSCTKDEMQSGTELPKEKDILYMEKAPVSFICYNVVSTAKLNIESNCSTMGWIQPGLNPSCIQPVAQSLTTLSVEGVGSVCFGGQSVPFIFNKGPNAFTCGQIYYIQHYAGPATRKVLKLQLKRTNIPFGPSAGGYFTYNLSTGQWTAAAGAGTYFCWSFLNLNQVPAVCC